nr:hypothetical protein [Bartonella alsatica]
MIVDKRSFVNAIVGLNATGGVHKTCDSFDCYGLWLWFAAFN